MTKQIKITSNAIADVYLQAISESDASDEYVQWLNDPLVNQYLETRFHQQDLASVIDFINSILNNPAEHLFTIRLKNSDKHIGNIKIGPINSHHNIGDVSLFIGDKDSWGKGIATQAISLISQYSFEYLNLRKLCAGAYKANVGSTKAFLKAGFVKDGVLANHYTFNGKPCDLVQVCLFNNQADKLAQIEVIPIGIN